MSTNTGVAPTSITASAVDIQVKLGTMTCSIHEKLMFGNRQAALHALHKLKLNTLYWSLNLEHLNEEFSLSQI